MQPVTITISPESIDAMLLSILHIEVQGLADESVAAFIWPTQMSPTSVSAVVEWHGTDLISTIVTGNGHESDWGQRFLLVWAATDCYAVEIVSELGAGCWSHAVLRLPDLDGNPGDTIQIDIDAQQWKASLTRAPKAAPGRSLRIPVALRYLNVGPLLCEMASRLLLKKSWLEDSV